MSALDEMLAAILDGVADASFSAMAFDATACDIGLGKPGATLLALSFAVQNFVRDSLLEDEEVFPTLWLVDADGRQWSFGADFTSNVDAPGNGNWEAMRLLLQKLDAVAYCIVQKTQSVRVRRDMTLLERQAIRDDPANAREVLVIFGESIDGGAMLLSYRIGKDGIDLADPISSVVGNKNKWPGPPGAEYSDHGAPELMPRGGWPE